MDAGERSPTVVVIIDGVETEVIGVAGLPADLGLVDALARLQLVARALGGSLCIRNPGDDLCALIELVGLADVLVCRWEPPREVDPLRLEADGEPECREELGIEEVVDPGDLSA